MYFYLNTSFFGNWWEIQNPRAGTMGLQGLKLKKTISFSTQDKNFSPV
jgi:hypothetical protein